jgi:hypothetical protein
LPAKSGRLQRLTAAAVAASPSALPFVDPSFRKEQFDVEGKTVTGTFGLLSPNKGIEHMVAALPTIAAKKPTSSTA